MDKMVARVSFMVDVLFGDDASEWIASGKLNHPTRRPFLYQLNYQLLASFGEIHSPSPSQYQRPILSPPMQLDDCGAH
jgi:hypothetical protein